MHDFRQLKIWQRSMDLATMVYTISTTFPKEEKYGLVSQIRSCAVSVPSNISEGAGRAKKNSSNIF
jgi:four helix bundle protein